MLRTFLRRYSSTASSKLRQSYTHERHPDKELFVFPKDGIRKTFSQFYHDAQRLGSGLIALGLQKGDRVGIWAPNVYEWVVAQFGSALAGMILVNINPAYRPQELEYCLRKVGIRCLISSVSFKTQNYFEMISDVCPSLVSSAPGHLRDEKYVLVPCALDHHRCPYPTHFRLPDLKHVVFLGDERKPGAWLFSEIVRAGDSESDKRLAQIMESQQSDEPVNIQFTSGTTGSPKGATLSHHNIINNCYFVGRRQHYHSKPTIICCPPPLYHCFGCVFGSLAAVVHGITCVFPAPSFDALACLKAVHEEKCTNLYGTPTMFIDMLSHKEFSKYNYQSLRGGTMAGAPCPVEVCKALMQKMNMTDFTVVYGTTENSPATFSTNTTDPVERRVGTVGTVVEHTEAKIIDHENKIVKPGVPGELLIRGTCVMLGYWHDDDKTKEVIGHDRWYRTGDQAVMDEEGYVRIVGRIKDMICRGGENIYPTEIERLLFTHPKVEDVHVVGVPDPRLGETVCAWIRLRRDVTCTPEEIKDFCNGKMARYKIPQYVLFKEEKDFPVTVTGKVQKYKMRLQSVEELSLRHVRPHFQEDTKSN